MKWKKPKEGDTRSFITFLFFPRKIGEDKKWLEYAIIEQEYSVYLNTIQRYEKKWIDIKWGEIK